MSSPLLIHIGLHKTGTTWLQQVVFKEPRFGFTRVWPRTIIDDAFIGGNPYAFNARRASALLEPFIEDARTRGTVPVMSHEPLSGRLILNGFDSKTIADRLHQTFPDAKILLVIREQRAMLRSIYKQYVRTFGTLPVEDVWRDYAPDERRNPTPGLEVFEYDGIIGYYQSLFGKENVVVLPYELLGRDAAAFVREITSFVGLPSVDDVTGEPRNVAMPGASVPLVRFTNRVLRALGLLGPFGGPIRDERLRNRVYRSTSWLGSKVPSAVSRRIDRRLQERIAEIVGERFAPSNRRASELTGLDLSSYGYDVASSATAPSPAPTA